MISDLRCQFPDRHLFAEFDVARTCMNTAIRAKVIIRLEHADLHGRREAALLFVGNDQRFGIDMLRAEVASMIAITKPKRGSDPEILRNAHLEAIDLANTKLLLRAGVGGQRRRSPRFSRRFRPRYIRFWHWLH